MSFVGPQQHSVKQKFSSSNKLKLIKVTITNLVSDGQEIPLLVGQLHAGLGNRLHGGGHVIVPAHKEISYALMVN